MKINFKARFKNKVFLLSFAALTISFVYKIFEMSGIIPSVSESAVAEVVALFVNILAFTGVIVDPTTQGISDSDRAMTYLTADDVRFSNLSEE